MTTTSKKKILILCRKAPYGNSLARAAFDIAMAASAFEQELAIVFIGDGVFQLLDDQNSEHIEQKHHGKLLSALSLYDIDDLYAEKEAFETRNIDTEKLIVSTTLLTQEELKNIFEQYDTILSF